MNYFKKCKQQLKQEKKLDLIWVDFKWYLYRGLSIADALFGIKMRIFDYKKLGAAKWTYIQNSVHIILFMDLLVYYFFLITFVASFCTCWIVRVV